MSRTIKVCVARNLGSPPRSDTAASSSQRAQDYAGAERRASGSSPFTQRSLAAANRFRRDDRNLPGELNSLGRDDGRRSSAVLLARSRTGTTLACRLADRRMKSAKVLRSPSAVTFD
jgi:hypothetical protein